MWRTIPILTVKRLESSTSTPCSGWCMARIPEQGGSSEGLFLFLSFFCYLQRRGQPQPNLYSFLYCTQLNITLSWYTQATTLSKGKLVIQLLISSFSKVPTRYNCWGLSNNSFVCYCKLKLKQGSSQRWHHPVQRPEDFDIDHWRKDVDQEVSSVWSFWPIVGGSTAIFADNIPAE